MASEVITPSEPRLRGDLILRRQPTAQGTYLIVKDPASGDFYRFGEVENFILQQLDGTAPLDDIRRRTESRFGAALSHASLAGFVQKLVRYHLLESDRPPRTDRGHGGSRVRGSLLYLRLPALDPTPILDFLLPRVRFCFTRWFVILSAAFIVGSAVFFFANWETFREDLTRLAPLSSIPLIIVILFLLVSVHEFGHGLACRHFGGEVREMGFMLIYFQPALYCNVSDAWLFPERSKRMWVGFAGPYVELCVWAAAVLAWRMIDVDTWISHVALIVLMGSGIKTLLNFNPLIKLDGYYLLSDFLDIPNLRQKSFRYVGDRIKRLAGWAASLVAPPTRREQRIFLAYGVIATVYSLSLLAVVVLKSGSFLIDNGQPLALAVLGAFAGTKLQNRIRGLMGLSTAEDSAESGSGHDPDRRPEPDRRHDSDRGSDAKGGSGREKARRSRGRRIMERKRVLLAAAAIVLVLLVFGRVELRVAGPANLLPVENADVRAPVAGIVEEIFVDEGTHVRAGQLIARLYDQPLLSELSTTESGIRENRALLSKLEAGPSSAEIAVARAVVAKAKDQAAFADARSSRVEQAYQLQAVSRREFEDAQAQSNIAKHERVEAQRRLDVLLAGTRREEIEATRARIEGMEARWRDLLAQARRLEVVSPTDGIVATPSVELHAMRRQFVSPGGLVAKVYDLETMVAQIMVSEKQVADLKPGQPIELRTRAFPGASFRGVLTSIAVAADPGAATTTSSQHTFPSRRFVVTSRIDNPAQLLRPGMTGEAKVSCGRRSILGLIARSVLQTVRVEVWSWW